MFDILKKIFGSSNSRKVKAMWPLVHRVVEIEQEYQSLTEEQLVAKTGEFKARLANGETIDDLLPEAYAAVKNACRRLCGREIEVTGRKMIWNMVPYDVQIMGGIVLHRGGIAEMATGEGKTLVATFPLYLNALTGRNCQLVTVNDYLALRDSQWMGAVYRFLGLTVGCIQNQMHPQERREQYACDITYGTNSEFGFDYLRDMGMASSRDELVQRDYFFAIVDEVDSVLIDEARTPLIISGPSPISNSHHYERLNPLVAELYKKQNLLCSKLIKEAKDVFDKGDAATPEEMDDAFLKVFKVKIGLPKHKQLQRMMEDTSIRRGLEQKERDVHSDNKRGYLQKVKNDLYFSINEKNHDAELGDLGRETISPDDPDAFIIPDLPGILSDIEALEIPAEEKAIRRLAAQEAYEEKSQSLHNLSQLLKGYCLFEKDVQYVVQDNKVMIVDEFTGRLMPGRRWSDGLHQAVEAKEGVKIERETQTLATITIQNYFRLYKKLAGMTGTAETEAAEFKQIYKLEVVVVPTNKKCIRIDDDDRIYKTKREKLNAIIDEIKECHERGQPVLVGTVSVDVSEVLSRMLRIQGVPHNVLNAKNHAREAEIVALAGQKGAVTIATNMAGRGTDIKLGEGVPEVGGLRVIGSERHDARRIDRQLRGRCSRQGDPGSSRFYVSLEDNLMRLFGSDRITPIMEKLGLEDGEELSHPMLNRTIGSSQRRVEQQHFSIRKRTLEYDDVMNRQRSVVYDLRKGILFSTDTREKLFDFIFTSIIERTEEAFLAIRNKGDKPDFSDIKIWLMAFPIAFQDADFEGATADEVARKLTDRIDAAYAEKEKYEEAGRLRWIEQQLMLEAIDRRWQEHLYAMDGLRQSVQLRAYGQKDPLVEYKKEAFAMFSTLVHDMQDHICQNLFKSATTLDAWRHMMQILPMQEMHAQLEQFGLTAEDVNPIPVEEEDTTPVAPLAPEELALPTVDLIFRRSGPKIGQNEQCPCGSGKKYKKCCGANSDSANG